MRIYRLLPTPFQHWYLPFALLACYPLSYWLPRNWSWENGLIENAQLLVLVCGGALALGVCLRPHQAPTSPLAQCMVPIWVIMAGREASWGATFASPQSLTYEGPMFSSASLWYKPAVAPAILVILLWTLVSSCRHRIDRILLRAIVSKYFPWLALAVAVGAGMALTCAEGRLPCAAPPNRQGFEELSELVGYVALWIAQAVLLQPESPD